MQVRIDHVTVCGSDLNEMVRAFKRVGIISEYGGLHANGLTHMALAGFEDGSYLELIAPVADADPGRATGMIAGWMRLMLENAGPGAWAIRATKIQEAVADLRHRGVEVRGPEPGGRVKPDGSELRWETAVLGGGAAGSLLPFMIEDRTERELRVRPTQQPLGVQGVAAVVMGVREIDAVAELFQRAFAWAAPEIEEHPEWDARLARFAEGPVILASALGAESWLAARVEKFGECPVAFLFSGRSQEARPLAGGSAGSRAMWFGEEITWFGMTGREQSPVGMLQSRPNRLQQTSPHRSSDHRG